MYKKILRQTLNDDDHAIDDKKSLSLLNRYYIFLKCHYFFLYATFGSFVPVLNITLRNRALYDIEILYINLIIPFIVFITNPLLGLFVDRLRRFRLVFNIILILATISLTIMFYLPALKSYSIDGQIYKSDIMEYSLTFCSNKQFASKCALRAKCGCTYQAFCRSLITIKNNLNDNKPIKTFRFNFTMDSTYVNDDHQNVSLRTNETSQCLVNYLLPIDQTINMYKIDQPIDLFNDDDQLSINLYDKIAICYVRCSINNICYASRYPKQILFILLYIFLIIFGLVLFAIATSLSTTITFFTLDNSNLFGKQRIFGTLGFGITAFIVSRLYLYFNKEYIYILVLIISTILCIISTSLINIQYDKFKQSTRNISKKSIRKISKNSFFDNHQHKDEKKKEILSNISLLIPLLKRFDVIVFLLTTFIWGTSFGIIDPYLILYIDEISPCESHSIAGYISLITASIEIFGLFFARKFLQFFGRNKCSIIIFLAFSIRFFGYYFIVRPYFILFMETMHFFNFGILYVLICEQALHIAPNGLSGTLQGLVYGMCYGLGRGIGLLISLLILIWLNKRHLFLIYSIFNLIMLVIYSMYCILNKRRKLSETNLETDGCYLSDNISKQSKSNPIEESLYSDGYHQQKQRNEMKI
ncbi:unnamed protein product [Rotaria sp. Silwood1]|nr:unnamed protein product [Rotaria sp. Silwood1]CAF1560830.1 unnamed protein product [Rotaria sp. Silwood1]CAF3651853.1 unnamed protein product [Rotaria sp. Silwood1]CAF4686143.1 unnamed protein product [Rotaria sp. Silwood1]